VILQSCLDKNAPNPTSNQLVYITIPQGNFVLHSAVTLHSYEILVGSSPTLTSFLGLPIGAAPAEWFSVPQYIGLANLSFKAPANPSLLAATDMTGNPVDSGHAFVDNVDFEATNDEAQCSGPTQTDCSEQMFLLSGQDIQVYNSVLSSTQFANLVIYYGDGAIISGNQFSMGASTNMFHNSQNIIAEMNAVTSTTSPGTAEAGAAFLLGRDFTYEGPSALSRNIYIGYNTMQNLGGPQQPVISTDGGSGGYYGMIASSTSDTVTLLDQPSWYWLGTTNPQSAIIAIVSGTGAGQYSVIQSHSGQTISLVTPWAVNPESDSIVVITGYALNYTISHNTLTNTMSQSMTMGGVQECVIEDNVLVNSGNGINDSSAGPYGAPAAFEPAMHNEILRNTIQVGHGDMITPSMFSNVAGIGEIEGYGTIMSGLVIRDNYVPDLQSIYTSEGENGLSAILVEQNQANIVLPNEPYFLVQDNYGVRAWPPQ